MLKTFTLVLGIFFLGFTPALAKEKAHAPAAAPPEPTTTQRVFDITRDGKKIGTDIIDIVKDGKTTTVNFTTHISVVIMFMEAYRLDHTAVETWNDGKFVSYTAQTNDNGKKHTISATLTDKKFDLTVDGKDQELPQLVLPATLWNTDFISATELFDPDKGTLLSVEVKDLGEQAIRQHGNTIQAEHYRISGDLKRDIWVVNDIPVRIKLLGSDGSKIVSDLRE